MLNFWKRRGPGPWRGWAQARRIIWESRGRLSVGLLLLLIGRSAGFVLPATSKYLVDDVLQQGQYQMLKWLAAAAIVATLLQVLTLLALSRLLTVTAQKTITEIRRSVYKHVLRLPTRFFDATRSGLLISRIMNDADGVRNLIGTGMVTLLGSLFTAVVSVVVLVYLNWMMTSVVVFVLASFSLITARGWSKARPIFRKRHQLQAEVSGRLGESLGGIRTVKAFRSEKHEELIFAKGVHRLLRSTAESIKIVSNGMAISQGIVGVTGILLLWMGGQAVAGGKMTLGDLIMYLVFAGMALIPFGQLGSVGTELSGSLGGLDRIGEILDEAVEEQGRGAPAVDRPVQGEISFHDVSFEYQPGVPVLQGVSFHAPAGTTTALVGSSGSGKSTLIGLIMAFIRPGQGRIEVDNRDLTERSLRDYRSNLGVVLQENVLFDDTIAENIRYARSKADREEVERVARIAHCHEFVERFPKGLDTIVGERGVKLSGGQRQRVAIARAILADPRILILDEATSSLDSESEALIQEGLTALRKGRTTFVIAHRLSTIRSADQILVIEEGRIVERGSHQELLELNGRYRELYDKQYRWEMNRFVNPGEEFHVEAEPGASRVGQGGAA